MTEYEYFKSLPVEEFAKLVVQHEFRYELDYAYDGEEEYPIDNLVEFYQTTDGQQFYFKDDAIEHQIEILKQSHASIVNDDREVICHG